MSVVRARQALETRLRLLAGVRVLVSPHGFSGLHGLVHVVAAAVLNAVVHVVGAVELRGAQVDGAVQLVFRFFVHK